MNYDQLMQVDLAKLEAAVTDWKRVAGDVERLGGEARGGLKAKADGARWEGVNAGVTRGFVDKTVKEFGDLHTEAQSVSGVLDDACAELKGLQQQAKSLTEDAQANGFTVSSGKDGGVVIAERVCSVERSRRVADLMRWFADTLTGVVVHANEIDAAAVRSLRGAHGGDPNNAGHGVYTSLDQDMLPRALKLAALGGGADEQQQKELRRLWQSLGPESRSRLWTDHKDDLLAAGLLTPQVKRVAADKGAGRFGTESPGASDYWKLLQARGMSNAGDFLGMPDAARHMDHYLRGTGTPLDLDVDRMLTDDANLRAAAAAARANERDQWRRQALDAFEASGGKPVALPVETLGVGYKHSEGADQNWYLAVGRAMTNTTGVVTAVPGPDGKPQVAIDYQVNVWDRYNWDAGKFTPIGPTSVTDDDMARFHTVGLAREFDMRGSSSVQQYDLDSGGPGPAPADPGRDGTRTDLGRNGDAR
ncbi:hypothetical protein ACQKM2_14290 [Streptomyces sp. NPDC004126]|uniref:hypothetical protein n=1 Tax=Streptomyces sp. NPDC004126 TaxID=3390695 RepID=UPI003D0115BF